MPRSYKQKDQRYWIRITPRPLCSFSWNFGIYSRCYCIMYFWFAYIIYIGIRNEFRFLYFLFHNGHRFVGFLVFLGSYASLFRFLNYDFPFEISLQLYDDLKSWIENKFSVRIYKFDLMYFWLVFYILFRVN